MLTPSAMAMLHGSASATETVPSTPSSYAATPSSYATTQSSYAATPSSTGGGGAGGSAFATGAASQRSTVTLQQLSAFAMRNVALPGAPSGELLDLYFKLDGHVVYVSEIVRNTLNPVWMPFEPETLAHLSQNMDGLHHHVSVAPLFSGTGFQVVVVRVRNYKMARRKSSALAGVIMADEDGVTLHGLGRKGLATTHDLDDEDDDDAVASEETEDKRVPVVEEVEPDVSTGFYFSGVHKSTSQRGAFDFVDDEDGDGVQEEAGAEHANALQTTLSSRSNGIRGDDVTAYEEEIFRINFNIRELDPLPIGLTEISNLPLNTCLLEFNDRFYVKREVIELLVEMGVISVKHSRRKGSAIQLKEYGLHDGIDNLERIRALRKHMEDVTEGNDALKEQIKQRLVGSESSVQKDHKRAAVQDRIQALRRQIADKKSALDRVKHIMHDERRTFETDIHIPKALLSMMQMSMRYKDEKQGILERRCEVLRAAHKIRSRQAMLVKELTTVYPIEYIGAGDNSIRGIRVLTSDLTLNGRGDEEQISTALGYIAHLTFMLSKYLHVNMRYKIVPYSSRSYVKDEINDPHGEYPLYRKGVERDRFERAIFFLRKDVEQLLFARGLDPTQGAPLLGRLDTLIKSEISWLEAERDVSNGAAPAAPAPSPKR